MRSGVESQVPMELDGCGEEVAFGELEVFGGVSECEALPKKVAWSPVGSERAWWVRVAWSGCWLVVQWLLVPVPDESALRGVH